MNNKNIAMNVKGTVTYVNLKMCAFTLNNVMHVFAGHMLAASVGAKLPAVGELVAILRVAERHKSNLFLDGASQIACSKHCAADCMADCSGLLQLIKELELTSADVLAIADMCAQCRKADPFRPTDNIRLPDSVSYEDVVLQIVPVLFKKDRKRSVLSDHSIPLKFPQDFGQNLCSILGKNKGCFRPAWTFQLPTTAADSCLIGYLRPALDSGFVRLLDSGWNVACSIAGAPELYSQQMAVCLNRFVLVRNFHFVAEAFGSADGSVQLHEYLCFNVADMHVLDLRHDGNGPSMPPSKRAKSFRLRILRRASVSVKDSKPQCIYHCLLDEKQYLFRLPTLLLSRCSLMNEGDILRLSTCSDKFVTNLANRKYDSIVDLSGLDTRLELYTFPLDMQLEAIAQESSEPVLPVREAYTLQQSGFTQLISFQGTVAQKRFFNKFMSRMLVPNDPNPSFGTQGDQMHQVVVKDDAECSSRMQAFLYLNNWERFQNPLGLVPNMRVAVRHVVQKKQHYYMPTFLTRIEPLAYVGPSAQWGGVFPLGDGHQVSQNARCLGTAQLVRVRRLTVYHVCPLCQKRWSAGSCTHCGPQPAVLNMALHLVTHDSSGVADVITKEHGVLRQLLGVDDVEWRYWRRCFRLLDHFRYGKTTYFLTEYDDYDQVVGDDCDGDGNDGAAAELPLSALKEALFLRLDLLSSVQILFFDLKCHKIDDYAGNDHRYPKWYCIDAHPTPILHRF